METDSESEVEGNGEEDTYSSTLDGPAATDLERPIDMEKAKVNDQHQRRIRQYSESQALISESFTYGLMSIKSTADSIWEKQDEEDRIRDLKNVERYNEMYNDMRHKRALLHDMKMASVRSDLVMMIAETGEKLIAAMEKLEQIDPLSLATDNQRLIYEISKKTVKNYDDLYEELGDILGRPEYQLSCWPLPKKNIESVGTSQRRIFNED